MRKVAYTLVGVIGVAALIGAVLFGANIFNPFADNGTEEVIVEDAVVEDEAAREIVTTVEPAADRPDVEEAMMMPHGGRGFENLEIEVSAELPTADAEADVYRLQYQTTMTVEEMRDIAIRLGFDGQLYQEQMPDFAMMEMAAAEAAQAVEAAVSDLGEVATEEEAGEEIEEEAVDPAISELSIAPDYMQQTWVAIDGQRRLNFYGTNVNYADWSNGEPYRQVHQDGGIEWAEAAVIAEQFLLKADLLPEVYEMRQMWGSDVHFFTTIDGILFDQPVMNVGVSGDGEIVYFDYRGKLPLESDGVYTVDSAETALNKLLENPDQFQFDYLPSADVRMMEMQFEAPRYWQRQFVDGATVTRSVWLNVYLPEDGGTPLVFAENMRVVADEAVLQDLADNYQHKSLMMTATVRKTDGGDALEVISFEEQFNPNDVYLNGTIQRVDDEVRLVIAGGLKVLLPDAPTEIEDGMSVGVFGWSISEPTEGLPVFDWMNIDEQIEWDNVEEPPMPDMGPFGAKELILDDVTLVYRSYYPMYEYAELATSSYFDGSFESLVPHWQFSGLTNDSSTLKFYVPAIDTDQLGK